MQPPYFPVFVFPFFGHPLRLSTYPLDRLLPLYNQCLYFLLLLLPVFSVPAAVAAAGVAAAAVAAAAEVGVVCAALAFGTCFFFAEGESAAGSRFLGAS